MAQMRDASFLVPSQYTVQSLYGSMQRSYCLVLLPHPSYGTAIGPPPYMRNVLHPSSYETSVVPLYLSPHHRYPQYPAYVPPTYYSLPAPPCQLFMAPNAPRHASIPNWQSQANRLPWQNRAYIPSWQSRAYVLSWQHRANIPP